MVPTFYVVSDVFEACVVIYIVNWISDAIVYYFLYLCPVSVVTEQEV